MVAVFAFIGYVMWRALNSDVAYLARPDIVFGATAFIGWVLTAVRFEKERHRFALIFVWSLLILGNLGMGLYQQYGDPAVNALSFLGFTRDYQDAIFGGFFPSSNHLCGFLELAAFPVLAIAVFGQVHSFVRVLCGLVFVAALFCVSQATSRGGLAFGVGVLAFGVIAAALHLMRKRRAPGSTAATSGLFAGLAVICLAIGGIAWGQLESKFGEGKVFNNLNGRTELWARAHEQWLENPVIGTGARSFEYYERSFRNLGTKWITWSDTDIDALFAHNDWVQVLADYGLAGLLLAAAVLGLHCWKGLSFLIADSHESSRRGGRGFFTDNRGAIVMGALCGMIPFAIHCVVDFHMHIGVNAVLAASVLGLMANPGRPRDDGPEDEAGTVPRRGWRAVAVAGAAVPAAMLGAQFLPWAISDYNFQMALGTFSRAADSPEDYFVAGSMMQRAVEADPRNYQALHYWGFADTGAAELLAGSVVQQQFLKKALDRFMAAHRLYPQNPDISANIGRTLDRLLRHDEAEKWFLKALAWGDGSRLIHHYYGDHLVAAGRYDDAIVHYTSALHRQGGRLRELLDRKLKRCIDLQAKERERHKKDASVPEVPGESPK